MLVLSRKQGQQVVIDGITTVTVLELDGNRVRLGFDAPQGIRIDRREIALQRGSADTPQGAGSCAAESGSAGQTS